MFGSLASQTLLKSFLLPAETMPSKPVLSDADKKAIRKKLEELCEECWIAQGLLRLQEYVVCHSF